MVPIKFNETADYEKMDILGVEGVFTSIRIDENSLPEGFYKYSLREGGDEFIGEISKNIMVNHAGDFITKEQIDLGPDRCRRLESDDWGFNDEPFDFEAYFGCKLSLDCQINKANAKKEAQMGGNAKEKQSEQNMDNNELL